MQQMFWPRMTPEEVLRLRPSDFAAITGTHELDEILRGADLSSSSEPRELTDEEQARIYGKRGTGERPRLRVVR